MRITSGGNVGIGSTSPQAKLDVAGSARFSETVYANSPTGKAALVIGQGGDVEILDSNGIGQFWMFMDNGRVRLVSRADGSTEGGVLDVAAGSMTLSGSLGIGTTSPQAKLDVAGKVNCTVLELTSDRAQKSGFGVVKTLEVLSRVVTLPLSTWHYTNELGVTHIGPMAQDFKEAFNVGSDDKHIATVDADGVLFAAVQGLNQKLEAQVAEKDARIAALEKEVSTLRQDLFARVAALEKQVVQSAAPRSEVGVGSVVVAATLDTSTAR
jgi:hypothetical protein